MAKEEQSSDFIQHPLSWIQAVITAFPSGKEECRGEEAEQSLYENLWQKVICGMGKMAK